MHGDEKEDGEMVFAEVRWCRQDFMMLRMEVRRLFGCVSLEI